MIQIKRSVSLETPLGFFQILPRELLHDLFDRISVHQLIIISLTSSIFNSEVRCYLLLENASRKFLAETTTHMMKNIVDLDPFYVWGILLKASTIIMDSWSRRSFLASFYCKNGNIINWPGWGRCFMAFCEKWDFHECEALMYMVLYFTELNQLLCEVLREEAGKYPSLEMEIRERLRGLFLSHSAKDERDYGFWISAILRTQETTKLQGKLFMIIFGPLKFIEIGRQIIDWEVLCNGSIILEHLHAKLLGPLVLGIHHLMSISNLGYYAWTNSQLSILMEEISTIPCIWTLDNFAALLALCPQIFRIALFTRLSEGRMNEAAHIFHAVKTILHRRGIFVSAAISDVMLKIFRALPEINRRLFLSSLLKTESDQLSGLLLATPYLYQQKELIGLIVFVKYVKGFSLKTIYEQIEMPREACEFCRRARARHKTRKKAGSYWYSSRGLGRLDWKQKTAKFHKKSPALLVMRNSKQRISGVDKQNEFEINPRLRDLVDLFKKENEIEEVPSPKDSASILLESASNVEIIDDSIQSPVLNDVRNQMSKETMLVTESKSTKKPSLAHFKIAETTLQQCADLLQSLPIITRKTDIGDGV
uniref:FBXO47 ARM repeats region domain-containing protein n=1 Tax=Onchocerca volvulus TaxID=6282 RepID=A0A8R1TUW3_ONCVO